MKRFLLVWLFPLFLMAEWDQPFLDEDDPVIVENVNVITGNLNLCFHERDVRGAVPFPITLTYSSRGAEEANDVESLKLKKMRNILEFDGGWSIFPHLTLLVDTRTRLRPLSYVMEPSGTLVSFDHKGNSLARGGQSSGSISGRRNPANHRLELDLKKSEAVVYLANGGRRIYRGEKDFFFPILEEMDFIRSSFRYLMLIEEVLPSGHKIFYEYSGDDCFERILTVRVTNPKGDKTFSRIAFKGDLHEKHKDFKTLLVADDGTNLKFGHKKYKKRKYITFNDCKAGTRKEFQYTKVRKGVGLSLEKIVDRSRGSQLEIEYYGPETQEESLGWKENPYMKPGRIDRVKTIKNPDGRQATFEYFRGVTAVRNGERVLTRYYHSGGRLNKIEYYDKDDRHVSSQLFKWDNGLLLEKTMCDANGRRIFSKNFEYDSYKNVVKETLSDDGESFTKWYEYDASHRLALEREEEGPTHRYEYYGETDLIRYKSTEGLEEHYVYDDDNLLIEKRVEDGVRSLITRYKRNPETGMVTEMTEPLKRHVYTYNKQKLPIQEEVFDAKGDYRYSLYKEYDGAGRVIRETTPRGNVNTYTYDDFGNATRVKEVGKPEEFIKYDTLNRPIAMEVLGKVSSVEYDIKGRICREKDYRGGVTSYSYDSFGRCILAIFADGTRHHFNHDLRGNVISFTDANHHITTSIYNLFRKPIRIVEANGAETVHHYGKGGELKETIFPEAGRITYSYDTLQRLISKRQGEIEERWEYEGSLLKTYRDPSGLVTHYIYDEYGRKIQEVTGERKVEYSYDPLGFLEKTVKGDVVLLQRFDEEGRVVEESENGFKRTAYTYDSEGRKSEAARGEAIDRFAYDKEGRLIFHIDPLGHKTSFSYGDFTKTTVDPEGNIAIETSDFMDRLIRLEKQSPHGHTCALEEFSHDGEGNVVKRVTTVFQGERADKKIEVDFEYNAKGLLTREVEANQKVTTYHYDKKGRLTRRISPNGVSIYYTYNEFDAVIELKSSDGTVHYHYEYDRLRPVATTDVKLGKVLTETYTPYGEIASEHWEHTCNWKYDDNGRVVELTLPDGSSIVYSYIEGHMAEVKRGEYAHRYLQFDQNGHVEEEALPGKAGLVKSKRDLLERTIQSISPFHECLLEFQPGGLVRRSINTLDSEKAYRYDALNQLVQEGEEVHSFDSIGNPTKYAVNDLNQITATEGERFNYDSSGNLTEREGKDGTTRYRYDALQRLISIHYPNDRKVVFSYDPRSRLSTIDLGYVKRHLIYDRDFEIGVVEDGRIKELKWLGLGIKGDIGGAVGIELDGRTFVPLHDLQGNVIGLATPEGLLAESYHFTSFGDEPFRDYHNPWRFSSKRSIEGLTYFGRRFYDPSLKRWLTPDPLGFVDGRNLYAYVSNSPLNRLDLFGLSATFGVSIDGEGKSSATVSFSQSSSAPIRVSSSGLIPPVLYGKGDIDGIPTGFIFCHWKSYKLDFSPEERERGHFNFFDHIEKAVSFRDNTISLGVFMNGVNTDYDCFKSMAFVLSKVFPIPMLGIYNESNGLSKDLLRVVREKHGLISDSIKRLEGFSNYLNEKLDSISSTANFLYIDHSEAGLIYNRHFERLSQKKQDFMRERCYYLGVGPLEPAPRKYAAKAVNIYSNKDYITGGFGKRYLNNPDYDIRILPCRAAWGELTAGFADHNFKSPTYVGGMEKYYAELEETGGITSR